jgi:hypothetical protein
LLPNVSQCSTVYFSECSTTIYTVLFVYNRVKQSLN